MFAHSMSQRAASELQVRGITGQCEERIRQVTASKDQELQMLRGRAERALREADDRHRDEMQRLLSELQKERERCNAERYHSDTMQNTLERMREDRQRFLTEGHSMHELEEARAQIRRLMESVSQLRHQVAMREAELNNVQPQMRSLRAERDAALAEQHRLRDQLERSRAQQSQHVPAYQHQRAQAVEVRPSEVRPAEVSAAPPVHHDYKETQSWIPQSNARGNDQWFSESHQRPTQEPSPFFPPIPPQTQWDAPAESFPTGQENAPPERRKHKKDKKEKKQAHGKDDDFAPALAQNENDPKQGFPTGGDAAIDREAVEALKSMGFTEDRILAVLADVGGSVEKAVAVLVAE